MTAAELKAQLQTPDELVEERTLDRLAREGLLDSEGIKALKGKLSAGRLKAEDWKLAFENAIEREAKIK